MLLSANDSTINVTNIYTPNNESPQFLEYVKNQKECALLDYCGDFNLVLDLNKDTYNRKM